MKIALHLRAVLVCAGLLLSITLFTLLAHADLTTPLTVNVSYPPNIAGGTTVGGIGQQQVFRLGSSAADGIFMGLDPKAGICPPGGTISFLFPSTNPTNNFQASRNAIGINDFVYAMRISNTASNVPLDTLLTGLCANQTITSIGFCQMAPDNNPTAFLVLPTGLDYFFFGMGQTIGVGESSVVLFYTSPDPPARQPTSIGSSGVSSNGEQPGDPSNRLPIYGACPTSITIDKKIGCAQNGPFTDGPQSALASAQIFYQITVTNTGMTPLDNVVITDAMLKAGGDVTGDFTFPTTPGHLDPGQSVTKVFGPFTATTGAAVPGVSANGTNTASVAAEYLIPDQTGAPSGQTFEVGDTDSVTLNVVAPALQCNKTVDPPSFEEFPVTLNYTLKATNTGGTDLSVTIDDTKLRQIITAMPAGVIINSVQIQGGAGFAPGTLANGGTNLPATFSVVNASGGTNPMAQVNISLTINSEQAFQSLADGPDPPDSFRISNTMTANGTVTNFSGCTTGANNTASCISTAVVMFSSCMISLEKSVACGTAPSNADFGPTATALKNAAIVYRYKVTNTGTEPLNGVTITDNRVVSPLFNVGTLAAGAMRIIDVAANAPLVVGPFVNTASASGTCAFSRTQVTSPQVNATVTVINPQVNCSKLVNGVTNIPNYTPGQTLTYTLTASNAASSGTSLDLKVDDPKISSLPGVSCKLADNTNVTLPHTFTNVPPGQSRTITCTVSFATGDAFVAAAGGATLNNTMSVMGTLPAGSTVCTVGAIPPPPFLCNSTASVTLGMPTGLQLTKEVACDSPSLDCNTGAFQTTTPASPLKVLRSADGTMTAAVRYRYRVTNTGNITVNNIVINDNVLGNFNVGALAPGALSNFICSSSFTPPPGVTTNTAVASGTTVLGQVLSNQATATVSVQQPTLSCSLTASACEDIGDPVTLTLTLTNGPIPVTIDSINGLPGPPNPAPPFTLAPNEVKAVTVTFNSAQAVTTVNVTVNGTVDATGFCLIKANGSTVSTQISTTCSISVTCGVLPKCDTICFRAPQWWALRSTPTQFPNGAVLVGGVNFNNPINIRTNIPTIKMALQGGSGPLQKLNEEFVAAQINLAQAGGTSSAPVMNALWSNISCSGGGLKNFAPVTLSNGVVITPNSMLKEMFMQAESAIRQNRTVDMIPLATLFDLLNGNNIGGACGPDGVGLKIVGSVDGKSIWEPEPFLLPRRIRWAEVQA
jgi:hypothetical protein